MQRYTILLLTLFGLVPCVVAQGPASSGIQEMTTVGDKVYFAANPDGTGHVPWVSDGTTQGTYELSGLAPGLIAMWPIGFCGLGDRVVFRAWSPTFGYEPYITDGTKAGTRLLKDIVPGPVSSYGGMGVMMEGKVYFAASASTGWELWVSDFTAAGTKIVVDLVPGWAGSYPRLVGARNGRLFFQAKTPVEGESLWVTDGSAAGTRLFQPKKQPVFFTAQVPVGSRRVAYMIQDAVHGREAAITDGSAKGTRVLDILPGPASGLLHLSEKSSGWIVLGSRLLFPTNLPAYGRELFVYDNGATAEPIGSPTGSTWLQGSDLVQGQSATLEAGTSLANAVHVTLVGAPAPRAQPLGRAGSLHLDLAAPILALGTDQGPRFQRRVPVPGAPALRGIQLMVQTLTFDATNLVGTMELSNALHWVLGL